MIKNWKNTHVSLLTIRNWKKNYAKLRLQDCVVEDNFSLIVTEERGDCASSRLIARNGFGSTLRVIAIKDDLG